MNRLTFTEKTDLKKKLTIKWPGRTYYGNPNPNNRRIKPCIRVDNPNETCSNEVGDYGGGSLKCYHVSFMVKTGRKPNKGLSHQCGTVYRPKGNASCIEASHVHEEKQNKNASRTTCHRKIRNWEIKNRATLTNKIKGPLFLSDIQRLENDRIQNGKGATKRIKVRKRDGDNETDTYYECPHRPHCFINYNKYNYEWIPKPKITEENNNSNKNSNLKSSKKSGKKLKKKLTKKSQKNCRNRNG